MHAPKAHARSRGLPCRQEELGGALAWPLLGLPAFPPLWSGKASPPAAPGPAHPPSPLEGHHMRPRAQMRTVLPLIMECLVDWDGAAVH